MSTHREDPCPLVSVILPSHNRRDEAAYTLDRLAEQDYPNLEIFVVDNGSRDGSADFLLGRHPRARILRLDKNLGTEARNLALAQARGEYVLMLDDDSHPVPGSISRMVRHFREDPALGAAAFRSRLVRESGQDEAGGTFNVFIGCGCGFSRQALVRIGGYPVGYQFYVEEYDVSYRLLEAGYKVRTFDDLVVHHRRSLAGRDFGRTLRYLVRNNLYLYLRYFPFAEAVRTLRWQMFRYWRFARAQNATPDYLLGLLSGIGRAARAVFDGRRLPEPILDQVVPDRVCDRGLEKLARDKGARKVAFWGVGKDFAPLVRAAKRHGMEVVGAFPAKSRKYYERYPTLMGVTLLDETKLGTLDLDALIVGSCSPGETRNELAYLKGKTNGTEVVPLFT